MTTPTSVRNSPPVTKPRRKRAHTPAHHVESPLFLQVRKEVLRTVRSADRHFQALMTGTARQVSVYAALQKNLDSLVSTGGASKIEHLTSLLTTSINRDLVQKQLRRIQLPRSTRSWTQHLLKAAEAIEKQLRELDAKRAQAEETLRIDSAVHHLTPFTRALDRLASKLQPLAKLVSLVSVVTHLPPQEISAQAPLATALAEHLAHELLLPGGSLSRAVQACDGEPAFWWAHVRGLLLHWLELLVAPLLHLTPAATWTAAQSATWAVSHHTLRQSYTQFHASVHRSAKPPVALEPQEPLVELTGPPIEPPKVHFQLPPEEQLPLHPQRRPSEHTQMLLGHQRHLPAPEHVQRHLPEHPQGHQGHLQGHLQAHQLGRHLLGQQLGHPQGLPKEYPSDYVREQENTQSGPLLRGRAMGLHDHHNLPAQPAHPPHTLSRGLGRIHAPVHNNPPSTDPPILQRLSPPSTLAAGLRPGP